MNKSLLKKSFLALLFIGISSLIFWFSLKPVKMDPQVSVPEKVVATDASQTLDISTVELRLGHDASESNAIHLGALEFARLVNEQSSGRIKIRIFPNQELGTDQEMVVALANGTLDMAIPPTAKLNDKNVSLFDTPFLFENREQAYEILDSALGKNILASLESKGLLCPVAWESGFKHFTSNSPIRSPEDFQGLRVRTMKSPIIMGQYRALGAKPIPIDFHKTRDALKDGVVTAQENPIGSIFDMGFHEVQNYLTLSNHGYLAQLFCFSSVSFGKLSNEDQELLSSSAVQAAEFQRSENLKQEKAYLEKVKLSNIKIIELDNNQIKAFRNATRSFINDSIFNLRSDLQEAARKVFLTQGDKGHIIIGLDADLSRGSAPAGISIKRGIELAIDEINEQGGLLGKNLSLYTKDHLGNSKTGIHNIKNLASNSDVVAIFSGLHSPVAIAEVPLVNEIGIPYLVPWAAATRIVSNGSDPNWVFRVSINDADAGGFLVSEATKNSRKIGLLLENTGWGKSNERAVLVALEQRGLFPTTVEWFEWGDTDFSRQLEKFISTETDTIILVANAPEGSAFVRNLANHHKTFSIVSHWGITGGYFFERTEGLGGEVDLKFIQTFSFLDSKSDKSQNLIARYLKKYKKTSVRDIIAPTGTAHAYDLVHLLALAIKKAGSTNRKKVRQALEELGAYEGLVKNYSPAFTREKHEAFDSDDLRMARFAFDGVITPIKK